MCGKWVLTRPTPKQQARTTGAAAQGSSTVDAKM